jgi:DHA2 family multidrug resistance protein
LPQAFRGFAQQFAVAPTITLTLGGLAPDRLKLASGLFNLMRNLGGAIGIAACGTVLIDRTNIHYLHIAERISAGDANSQEALQSLVQHYASLLGGDEVHAQAAAMKELFNVAWREAQTQTIADAFLLIAICFVIATAMVPLMRKVGAPKAPSAEAH